MAKVLILAAGSGTRWGDFRDVPKHLVEVEGETLLERTCRQFLAYSKDVTVVGPDDLRYRVFGCALYTPSEGRGRELEKFASSLSLWSSEDRTILAYGDVYFTDEAVATIMSNNDPWKFFCRSGPSNTTGKNCKEIFAIGFAPEKMEWMSKSVMSIIDMPTTTGGWSLFRLLTLGVSNVAVSDRRMFDTGNHVEIDDWTEDFDFPVDLVNWEQSRQSDKLT
jgi:hypothetical protein